MVKDAKALRDWMSQAILEDPSNTVVVFSHDVMPDTAFDDISGVATVRRYLDRGGRCVWLGDIPFYYKGKPDKKCEDMWKTHAHINLLGVNPVFSPAPTEPVRVTGVGRSLGLKTSWSGIRPIEKDKRVIVLAKSRQLYALPSIVVRRRWRFGISRIEISASPKVEITPEQPTEPTTFGKTYPNAWLKIFSRVHPQSGFLRIWDYPIRKPLTQQELSEMLTVSVSDISWVYRHPRAIVA